MDLFISLLVLWFLKVSIQGNNSSLKPLIQSAGAKIFLAWVVVVALGYFNALNNAGFGSGEMNSALIIKGLSEFKWVLVLLTLIYVLKTQTEQLPKLFKHFSFSLMLACLFAIGIFFYGEDPLNHNPTEHKWGSFYRTGGFLQSPMTMANLYVLYFSVLAGYFIERFTIETMNLKKLSAIERITLIATVITGLAVLLSFTRGVWLGLFFGLTITFLIVKPKLILKFMLISGATLATVLALFAPFRERLFYVFNSSGYDSERFWIWKANWEIVKEHFFIGVGYMHNKNLLPEILEKIGAPASTLVSHAHNQYLHFLAGTGILGLACYLAFWGYFLKLNYQGIKNHDSLDGSANKGLLIGCLIAQITFLFSGLTESNFEHTKVRYGVFFVWALVWTLSKKENLIFFRDRK
jgi:O-antigen ligase